MLSNEAERKDDLPPNSTPRVVITTGSYTCRAGFSSEKFPRSVIPMVVGTPLNLQAPDLNRWYCGKEAISMRANLTLKHPIERGIVTNFDDVVKLFTHVFYNELKVNPRDHAVMLSEVPIGPKANRERMTQIMFETFNVGALYIKLQMVLSLIASGRLTGIVVHSGSGTSRIVPIYMCYWMPHAMLMTYGGGDDVTTSLIRLLSRRGYSFTTAAEIELVKRMKEKLAYVSEDYRRELSQPGLVREREYRLPDGRVVKIGSERFQCAECLFDPSQIGHSAVGLGRATFGSVMKCDVDIRRELYNNVLLSGGNSMLEGMERRLERELKGSAPAATPVRILSPPYRDVSSWYGGAILSSHSAMSEQWITKAEYDESGPSVTHRKCF